MASLFTQTLVIHVIRTRQIPFIQMAIMLLCYVVLTQLVKMWFIRRFGE